MSTHITHLLLRSARARRSRVPAETDPAGPMSANLSSWSACALQALAHTCAMGMIIPPLPPGDAARERRDAR